MDKHKIEIGPLAYYRDHHGKKRFACEVTGCKNTVSESTAHTRCTDCRQKKCRGCGCKFPTNFKHVYNFICQKCKPSIKYADHP